MIENDRIKRRKTNFEFPNDILNLIIKFFNEKLPKYQKKDLYNLRLVSKNFKSFVDKILIYDPERTNVINEDDYYITINSKIMIDDKLKSVKKKTLIITGCLFVETYACINHSIHILKNAIYIEKLLYKDGNIKRINQTNYNFHVKSNMIKINFFLIDNNNKNNKNQRNIIFQSYFRSLIRNVNISNVLEYIKVFMNDLKDLDYIYTTSYNINQFNKIENDEYFAILNNTVNLNLSLSDTNLNSHDSFSEYIRLRSEILKLIKNPDNKFDDESDILENIVPKNEYQIELFFYQQSKNENNSQFIFLLFPK